MTRFTRAPSVWLSKHAVNGPALVFSCAESVSAYAEVLRPFHDTHLESSPSYLRVAFLISSLLGRCGPTAIPRLIIAFVINTFKRVAFWFLSHIRRERLEAVAPGITHRYASTSVSVVAVVIWVVTSRLRVEPRGVKGRVVPACCVSVRDVTCARNVIRPTSTTLTDAAGKVAGRNAPDSPAVTATHPLRFSGPYGIVVGSMEDYPPTESLSRSINKRWHL